MDSKFKKYYEKNKEELSKKKKEKYQNDPLYRKKMLENSSRSWKNRSTSQKFEQKEVPSILYVEGRREYVYGSRTLARIFCVGYRSVERYAKEFKIPHVLIGDRCYYFWEFVHDIIPRKEELIMQIPEVSAALDWNLGPFFKFEDGMLSSYGPVKGLRRTKWQLKERKRKNLKEVVLKK